MLADEYKLIFISLSAHIQPTEFYSAFVVNFNFIFQLGCSSGMDIIKFQHSSKPCSLAAITSKTTSSIKIYQSTMCNVYRSVGSLTTIKSHLQRNNVTGLTSLNELIAFQKNYSTSRQQIISKHELSITQEKNDLNSEISQLDQLIKVKKTAIE
jgi:hypothetical protein